MTKKTYAVEHCEALGIKDTAIVKSCHGDNIKRNARIDILAKWPNGTFSYLRNVRNSASELFWVLDDIDDPFAVEFMEAYPVTDNLPDHVDIDPNDIDPYAVNEDRFSWNELTNEGPRELGFDLEGDE